MSMKIGVILPAAGMGKRFAASASGEAKSKIELPLAGRPVFQRAIELFCNRPDVVQIIMAVHPDQVEAFRFKWGDKLELLGVTLIAGGTVERWQTVQRAIDSLADDCTHVAVHDAARPLTSAKLIDRVFAAAAAHDAVIPGASVNGTLKRVADVEAASESPADPLDAILGNAGQSKPAARKVVATVDRSNLVEVQTPQIFKRSLLVRAYAQISTDAAAAGITDDAGLVERLGETVYVVEGEATNLKVTRPDDMALAEAIARDRDAQAKSTLSAKRLFANLEED